MKKILILSSLLFVTACAVGPDYFRPSVDVPDAYKERQKDWMPATPQDDAARGPWWSVFKDATLDDLEKQADAGNQTLKVSEAAYRQAAAIADEARAGFFPLLTANASGQRSGGGSGFQNAQGNQYGLSGQASWAPDLWGRVRRTVEANTASEQESAADLANAKLSLEAALATDYFNLRAADELKSLLDDVVKNYTDSLAIVQHQYDQGIIAKADVLAADTQLKSAQAQAIAVGVQRAQLEHAIAILVGKLPSSFALKPASLAEKIPDVPTGMPSTLLQRRPDIASSERAVAAANANIGVAVAAFYPDLTLSASYGRVGSIPGALFQAPNSIWALGPAIAETIFDGGLRSATKRAAVAVFDETTATYRQTVLTAFQQVEDGLSSLRILADQAVAEDDLVKSAVLSEKLSLNQYKAGIVPYSTVIVAENAALSSRQNALAVRQSRLVEAVALTQALGGGWNVEMLKAQK